MKTVNEIISLASKFALADDEYEARETYDTLKSAIEELVSKPDMGDAMLAGNAALIADMKSKLNECHAALSFLLDRKPQFGAFDYGFGSATLGNLRAELGIYKVKETP